MKNKLPKRRRYLPIGTILSISIVVFCSFTGTDVTLNLHREQSKISDTIPAKELSNIKWNEVNQLVASNGALIARLNNAESLIIARRDYEIYASENDKVSNDTRREIFTKVEIEPEYPGGATAWLDYVKSNINYSNVATDGNSQSEVIVQFIVNKKGNLEQVEAISGPTSGGFREEAIRLVTEGGNWHPAIQNFHIVKAYKRQAVTFDLKSQQQKNTSVAPSADPGSGKTESEYPGGRPAWMRYLTRNLRYPAFAQQNNIQGTVKVSFTVDEKGRLKQFEALSGARELQKEAIRVIKDGGRWIPAKENGNAVSSQREQSITFKTEYADDYIQKNKMDSSIAKKLDRESTFPGGPPGWMIFLNKEMRYPLEAQKYEIQGTVTAQFIVDKDGTISEVEAVSGPTDGGLREEVVRIIKRSGTWIPATLQGVPVKSYKRQIITFKLEPR